MRVYKNFRDAKNEIARDLNELGMTIFAGYQSKELGELSGTQIAKLTTKELIDYDYIVTDPKTEDLDPMQPWADREWRERLAGILGRPLNPGHAWEARKDLWEPLLEQHQSHPMNEDGREFSYTYSERLHMACIPEAIEALKYNMYSRQIWIPIWHAIDNSRLGKRRVPCSLGYQISCRHGQLNIAYHMRSSDFKAHFDNDIWMALKLLQYFSDELSIPRGTFTHKIGSLHVYASEVANVF